MNEPSSPATPPSPSAPNPRPTGDTSPRFCTRCGASLTADGSCAACILQGARTSGPGASAGGFVPRSIEAMNAALPAYEFQTLIGQGGMGAVYRARHKKLDRLVAIKVLRPTAAEEDSASFAERFEREARVLAKLDHPHIVRIYDFGRTDADGDEKGFFYLALEYVDGASLRDLMRDGRLTAKEVLELIPQVCEALQTAHGLGVIHRDIKPENILVDGEGRVRIADFGLAKLSDAEPTGFGLTQTNQTFGTLHYMAPEQMRGAGAVDHRADLYSLGVVLYEMLTGELPLGRFVAPSKKSGEAKDLDGVVFRALENEPDARYQAALDLKRDLVAGAEAPQIRTRRRRRVRRLARTLDNAKSSQMHPGTAATAASRTSGTRPVSGQAATQQTSATRASRLRIDPRSAAATRALLRSWSIVAALALIYGMYWMELRPVEFFPSSASEESLRILNSNGLFSGSPALSARPYAMNVAGLPLWLGLVAMIVAAVLRSLISGGRAISTWYPTGLSIFAAGLMVATLVSFASENLLHSLRLGFALAFVVHGWAVFADLSDQAAKPRIRR